MLKDLNLQPVYRSDCSNIVQDFYVPALSCATRYDRAVGFFSASMLSLAAQGIGSLIKNGGTMRLVVGAELAIDEADAINDGYLLREIAHRHISTFFESSHDIPSFLFQNRLRALSWLVAAQRLEVKVAFTQRGMYHEKIGIIYDGIDAVVFQGSANESASALSPDYNFESINVFPAWKSEFFGYVQPYVEGFEKLWSNKTSNVKVIDFPDISKNFFVQLAKEYSPARAEEEIRDAAPPVDALSVPIGPAIPTRIGGRTFSLFDHQRQALNAWRDHGCQGLFELATGAGKTITALYGSVRIYENSRKLFLVISVPYQNLADQWAEEVSNFSITPIKCYQNKEQWYEKASTVLNEFLCGQRRFACFIVVNRTLTSQHFKELLNKIPSDFLFFIGDECHHHASKTISQTLPTNARYRIGLSATLEFRSAESFPLLENYYGPIVSSYTLEDALKDKILTPYRYYIHSVDLTPEESDKYLDLTAKIRKAFVIDSESEHLKSLLLARARLLGAATGKLDILRSVLQKTGKIQHSLFYCGDGTTDCDRSEFDDRQIDLTTRLLHDLGWISSRFTSYESREQRKVILDCFKVKTIDALVAIRCLDEGIDVPACTTAFILASSTNPRQQIQRRGRILRRSEGKSCAFIHDFFVRLPPGTGDVEAEKNLVERELARVFEFAKLAQNRDEALQSIARELATSDMDYLVYSNE